MQEIILWLERKMVFHIKHNAFLIIINTGYCYAASANENTRKHKQLQLDIITFFLLLTLVRSLLLLQCARYAYTTYYGIFLEKWTGFFFLDIRSLAHRKMQTLFPLLFRFRSFFSLILLIFSFSGCIFRSNIYRLFISL